MNRNINLGNLKVKRDNPTNRVTLKQMKEKHQNNSQRKLKGKKGINIYNDLPNDDYENQVIQKNEREIVKKQTHLLKGAFRFKHDYDDLKKSNDIEKNIVRLIIVIIIINVYQNLKPMDKMKAYKSLSKNVLFSI